MIVALDTILAYQWALIVLHLLPIFSYILTNSSGLTNKTKARASNLLLKDQFFGFHAAFEVGLSPNELNGVSFYSLYGHLTRNSLSDLHGGKRLETGESFAEIGSPPTNGDWPPHVHFQIMTNLLGNSGDFPGVIEASKEDEFRLICLDPNLFLRFGTTT